MIFHNYKQRVLSVGRGSLILYHPMDEHSGLVAVDASPEGNNGAYSSVTLNAAIGPDGRGCPQFDAINDYNNIYSAGLSSDFNGQLGSMHIVIKVFNSGVWTDGAYHTAISLTKDSNNTILIQKIVTNNTLRISYRASGILQNYDYVTSSTDWISAGLTWDKAGNELKFYIDGVKKSDQGVTGTFAAGGLISIATAIGVNTTSPVIFPFNGYIAHGAIWNTPLSEDEMSIIGRQ